jgi:tetratricopeptide (TPR) repeat protein
MKRAFVLLALVWALGACGPMGGTLAEQWAVCQSGMMAEQRAVACTAVIADPNTEAAQRAVALLQRGRLRAEIGQHARAVADYGRALRIDQNLAQAYAERGFIHEQRGAFDRAIRDYDAALAVDPGLAIALERRDEALVALADSYRGQVEAFTEALTRSPNDTQLLNGRCWVRGVNGEELDAALADCNAALLLEPGFAAALDSRGLVNLKRGAFAEAFADYDAALAVDPGRGHYLYGRGLARLGMGQAVEAQQDFAAAETAEPGVTSLYASYRASPNLFELVGQTQRAATSGSAAKP